MDAVEMGALVRGVTAQSAAAADLLAQLRLAPGYRPENDPGYGRRVDALVASEA